ncbi:4-hydroxyphenylacetate 3-hydroxylase C-terminal domain-containing protein [Paenarthrobacter sp. PH39-S1]|uniref:4-hydroxyphenylacetate 3-hydroxylase C-terminal domain-containing protein n=1 Tax=Paenarthrobacter sp. PH39-S1 TaxID=3046204 RepID=UPI0024B9C5AB|nr:4-hydroxyphenylacetate 3-hydroxylase C-terminal domain-containing protein [Paenarthrobacter sp. PH39-S1]MDJ0358343.1 4-hydroxyphenylacetate 3-hydroxylase C-terminal domain-containing protein [Paenarthrobacter sp. PH39-S1]
MNSSALPDIELFLQAKTLTGPERVRLFKLAYDASISSSFSGRQALYEYFFFGDPVRMAGALVNCYDREPVRARVRSLLQRED